MDQAARLLHQRVFLEDARIHHLLHYIHGRLPVLRSRDAPVEILNTHIRQLDVFFAKKADLDLKRQILALELLDDRVRFLI